MSLLRNLYSHGSAADSSLRRGEVKAEQAQNALERLEERVDQLILVNMALWSLIREHSEMTEEDLVKRVVEIDMADGELDGRTRPRLSSCGDCGQTLSRRHNHCLYCGHEPDDAGAFSTIAP